MARIYATDKLAWHPEVLEGLRQGVVTPPVLVQLFPSNVCNQACQFCSYGSGPEVKRAKVPNPPKALWKNQQLFQGRDILPWPKCRELVLDCVALGTKAFEITGGGEPTAYPFFEELLVLLQDQPLDTALVTNGTLLDVRMVKILTQTRLTWARVSIDAGSAEDYCATRFAPRAHWEKAWQAVTLLATNKPLAETAIGVGFVLDLHNHRHLYDCVKRAKEAGADNIRLSLSFTPDGTARWAAVLQEVAGQIALAQTDFAGGGFTIHDLITERAQNVVLGRQTYPFCAAKEVICVIGADQNVYACCSLAYNPRGRMGSIATRSFADLWREQGWRWRQAHDPRRDCRIQCLYEKRNMEALRLMGDPVYARTLAQAEPPPHRNFI